MIAALVLQEMDTAGRMLKLLREQGISREAVREAILQTYLFDGYPTALEGMIFLADQWPGAPQPVESASFDHWPQWEKRGWELYTGIYGGVADHLQQRARQVSPELAQWMIVEGYGKVLSRGILSPLAREMVIVAVLAVKNRPRQLHSHLRGALRMGAAGDDLGKLLDHLEKHLAPDRLNEAKSLLHRLSGNDS